MSNIQRLLADFAVPLQVWLTPEARKSAADPLREALEGKANIHANPLSSLDELTGPAVLVIAASELEGRRAEELRVLAQRAHPGRAVLIGGTSDRDTLMKGINDWGVVRVVPVNAGGDDIVSAVRAAGENLKREVALESAIDDLDIETTMLDSAIDHIDAGRDAALRQSQTTAANTLATGLATALRREGEVVQRLPTEQAIVNRVTAGIEDLAELVEQSSDRAIERAAGLPPVAEKLDEILNRARRIWSAQCDEDLLGHIGTGSLTHVDPFAITRLLLSLLQPHGTDSPARMDAHRSGDSAWVELSFRGDLQPQDLTMPDGVTVTPHPTDEGLLRLIIPLAETTHG